MTERQMIKAYIIERAFGAPDNATLDELENLVNNRIAEGYVPVGVPFYFENGIAQVMLRKEHYK